MKMKVLLLLFIMFFIISCEKDEDQYIKPLHNMSACGNEDPLNQLKWLNDLANKSLEDETGNYIGSIWIMTYKSSNIIVTDMALGSGGVMYYFFDCNGEQPSNLEDLSLDELNSYLTDSTKIFTNIN